MEPTKYDIFVSYSHADGELVASLISRLREENIVAFADRSIQAGELWMKRLHQALSQSEAVLFLATPSSLTSNWAHAEAGAAWILHKRLIPVVVGVGEDKLIDFLRERNVHKLNSHAGLEDLVGVLKDIFRPEPLLVQTVPPAEFFLNADDWSQLLHIGDWIRDADQDELAGEGMYAYLLSRHTHGPDFSVSANFRISNARPENALDAINAGIVLGWTTPKDVCRYYNLLMTGDQLLLELIGGRGFGEYSDFQHLDEGVPFVFKEGIDYRFSLDVKDQVMKVKIRSELGLVNYQVSLPEPINGRVGLRPWRCRLHCAEFVVSTRSPVAEN